jgi:hypothetical protein
MMKRIFFLLAAFFVAAPVVGAVLLSDKALAAMTRDELIAVETAFQQSTYYRYYEALVAGRDKIRVDKIARVRQETRPDGKIIALYELHVTLIIEGTEFKRIVALELEMTAKVKNPRRNMVAITGGVEHVTAIYSRALFSLGRVDFGAILQAGYSRAAGHVSAGICIFF